MRRGRMIFILVVALGAVLTGGDLAVGQAPTGATITVDNTTDDFRYQTTDEITLREALSLATSNLALPLAGLDQGECARVNVASWNGTLCVLDTGKNIGAGAADTIVFDVSGTIQMRLATAWDMLNTGDDEIDGSMEAVTIDGRGTHTCFYITSDNNTIRGLTIQNCVTGIEIDHGNSNTIGGTVGTTPGACTGDCNRIKGNGTGIEITATAGNTVVGNVIEDSTSDGLQIGNSWPVTVTGNVIQANGGDGVHLNFSSQNVTVTGNVIDRNTGVGVHLRASSLNTVGGATPGAQNSIINNVGAGVQIAGGATNNRVAGNQVNFNVGAGIRIKDTGSEDNVVSGNVVLGSRIGVGIALESPDNRVENNRIDGSDLTGILVSGSLNEIVDNEIVFNLGDGVEIRGSDNKVTGNTIAGNYRNGVLINDALGNTIGGDSTAAGQAPGNVIQSNESNGIEIRGVGSSVNTVQGNRIAWNAHLPDPPGQPPTGRNGILITDGAHDNEIGGNTGGPPPTSCTGACNVISNNDEHGIEIAQTSHRNYIMANFIEINGSDGVAVFGWWNAIGARHGGNVISANGGSGVRIEGAAAHDNYVQGNFIGTDSAGILPNGNMDAGVEILNAPDNHIGGPVGVIIPQQCESECNLISANVSDGVLVSGSGATGTEVEGNFIGTDVDLTINLGNSGWGVHVHGADAKGITDNHIWFNVLGGITIHSSAKITGNSFYANGGPAIDLGGDGVTPNDPRDGDTGPNGLQNYPVISSATGGAITVNIQGSLNSTANREFVLEFYSSKDCDPSGFGEGENFLGAETVTTDGSGNVTFAFILPMSGTSTYFVTATATDPVGNTSEFSACRGMPVGGTVELVGGGSDPRAEAQELSRGSQRTRRCDCGRHSHPGCRR